jgi:hypothetical protein
LDTLLTAGVSAGSGFLLAGKTNADAPGAGNPYHDGKVVLFGSADGRTWTPTTPAHFDPLGAVAQIAGGDAGIILLGTSPGHGDVVTWRYRRSGEWGQLVPLNDVGGMVRDGAAKPDPVIAGVGGARDWAIASGPAGVLVAHENGTSGVQLWSSKDGSTFTRQEATLRGVGMWDLPVRASATADGFLLISRGRMLRVDANAGR